MGLFPGACLNDVYLVRSLSDRSYATWKDWTTSDYIHVIQTLIYPCSNLDICELWLEKVRVKSLGVIL